VVVAVVGWNVVRARSETPAKVADYVDGGGVRYESSDLGYSVRLPEQPEETSETRRIGPGSFTAYGAIVEGNKYEIGMSVVDMGFAAPSRGADANEFLRAAVGAGATNIGGTVENSTLTQHRGSPAIDAVLDVDDDYPARIRVVLSGTYMYIAIVHSAYETDAMFDELVGSLELA
jgi:hypothetical protein